MPVQDVFTPTAPKNYCPVCKGSGWAPGNTKIGVSRNPNIEPTSHDKCAFCQGTGKV